MLSVLPNILGRKRVRAIIQLVTNHKTIIIYSHYNHQKGVKFVASKRTEGRLDPFCIQLRSKFQDIWVFSIKGRKLQHSCRKLLLVQSRNQTKNCFE